MEEKGCCNIAKGFFCPLVYRSLPLVWKLCQWPSGGNFLFFKENRNFQLRQDLQYRLSESETLWVGLEGWSCLWNKPSFKGAVWKEVKMKLWALSCFLKITQADSKGHHMNEDPCASREGKNWQTREKYIWRSLAICLSSLCTFKILIAVLTNLKLSASYL